MPFLPYFNENTGIFRTFRTVMPEDEAQSECRKEPEKTTRNVHDSDAGKVLHAIFYPYILYVSASFCNFAPHFPHPNIPFHHEKTPFHLPGLRGPAPSCRPTHRYPAATEAAGTLRRGILQPRKPFRHHPRTRKERLRIPAKRFLRMERHEVPRQTEEPL